MIPERMLMFAVMSMVGSLFAASLEAADAAMKGLVFEVEEYTQPTSAWKKDSESPTLWNLSTTDPEAKKWSKGSALKSPPIEKDRTKPEEGAPVLHTKISGIPAGTYRTYLNDPGRVLSYSYNGTDFIPGVAGAEILLGIMDIKDGNFELWADDFYSTGGNPGSCYYDYIRFEPYTPPTLSSFQAVLLSQERVQVSWISSEPMDTGQLEMETEQGFIPIGRSQERGLRNHRVFMGYRAPGMEMRVRVKAMLGRRYIKEFEPVTVKVPPEVPNRFPTKQIIPLRYAAPPIADRTVTLGLPLKSEQLFQETDAWVQDKNGPLQSQTTITARWPDGSAKWLLVHFLPKDLESPIELHMGPGHPTPANPFTVVRNDDELIVDNGRIRWRTPTKTFALFGSVEDEKKQSLVGEPLLGNIRLVDEKDQEWGLGRAEVLILEEQGPVQTVVRAEGAFQEPKGERFFRYRLRYFLTAGSPLVRVQLTVTSDASESFVPIKSLACRIPLGGEGPIEGQLAGGEPTKMEEKSEYSIQQVDDKKFRIQRDGKADEKESRNAGWGVAQRDGNRVAVAVRDFWQTWPKGIALKSDGLHIRLLPKLEIAEYQPADKLDWLQHHYWFKEGNYLFKQGMSYRADFWVRFDQASDPLPAKDWSTWAENLQTLPYAGGPPTAYCESGAFGSMAAAHPDKFPQYEDMVERTFANSLKNRETYREYGWMNFGDWWGERDYNWGNSEYDWSWAMASQFARTGRWDYFRSGDEMARHYATIDTIQISFTPLASGRLFGHSIGHVGVGQDMPEKLRDKEWLDWRKDNEGFITGFVDTGGHIHTEGSFIYYLLTGDRDYLQAGEIVSTAQATYLTPRFDFDIERGAGWPLANAMAAYNVTNNPFYLNAARIYFQKVRERQDPKGGGWQMWQGPPECPHEHTHTGGKPFAAGALIYGLMHYHMVEPKEDVKESIVRACDWLVNETWNKERQGFRYKTGCDSFINEVNPRTTALCVAGLAYAFKLTGDNRYREVLLNVFPKMCETAGDVAQLPGMMLRQSAQALPAMEGSAPTTKPSN